MVWSVRVGEDAKEFLATLTDDESTEVYACIVLLKQFGPNLPRPHSGTLRASQHSNMKELRVPYKRKQFRILYAFDTEQNAILLIGGDKVPVGEKLWYPKFIGRADNLYSAYEKTLEAKRNEKESATKADRSTKTTKGKRPKR